MENHSKPSLLRARPAPAQAILVAPQPKAKPDVSHFDKLPDAAMVAIKALAAVMGQGISTTWRNCQLDPDYPKPIRLSPGCTRFNVGDIRAYLAKKTNESAQPINRTTKNKLKEGQLSEQVKKLSRTQDARRLGVAK